MRSRSGGLSVAQFAELLGLPIRTAKYAIAKLHSGHAWRGFTCNVSVEHGRGGASGVQYRVAVASLPAELRERAAELGYIEHNALPAPPVPAAICKPSFERGDHSRRLALIAEALKLPPNSKERGAAVRASAAASGVSVRTLYRSIDLVEKGGPRALVRKSPKSKGQVRHPISRKWSQAIRLSRADQLRIMDELDAFISGLWKNTHTFSGWSTIARDAALHLFELSRAAGCALPDNELRAACEVKRHFVNRTRRFRDAGIYRRDRKTHDDRLPSIQRHTRFLQPMERVVGDVHPMDVLYRREDGSTATAKLIAWQDRQNLRYFIYPMFCEKGQGVTGEDVVASFVAMVQAWGMPGSLSLDNGSEFFLLREIADDPMRLAMPIYDRDQVGMVSDKPVIATALPYNARGKGSIEGGFGNLERRFFSLLSSWIAGDRMKKKTSSVGRPTEPFDGTREELSRTIEHFVRVYNETPQHGRTLNGLSPNDAVRAAIAGGWKPVVMSLSELIGQCCRIERRRHVVTGGTINYRRNRYYHDDLARLPFRSKVEIRVPLFGADDRLAVFALDGKLICIVEPDMAFADGDRAGAIESARRKKVVNDHMRSLLRQAPDYSLNQIMELQARYLPQPPAVEPGAVISLSDEAAATGRALTSPAERRAEAKRREAEREKADKAFSAGLNLIREQRRREAIG